MHRRKDPILISGLTPFQLVGSELLFLLEEEYIHFSPHEWTPGELRKAWFISLPGK